ncbi:MAG TPA: hypothetical protein VJ696_02660 [Rhodanobacteraceae bacterium]|nr:hypothetical protein [Rhodanobacteraceae bacterium]
MNKSHVVDIFGVVRAIALAVAGVALVFIVAVLGFDIAFRVPLVRAVALDYLAAYALIALVAAALVALFCSLARWLVGRMRFASST